MRISDSQVFGLVLSNLQRQRLKLLETQKQASSGKKVSDPSDDPAAFGEVVAGKLRLGAVEQRLRNIQFGGGRLDRADGTLDAASSVIARIRELAVDLRNDVHGAPERAIGAKEVRQLLLELQQLANTSVNGHALFTGTSTHGRAEANRIYENITLTDTTDSLVVTVDGVTSGALDLTSLASETFTGAQLAARVQARINADAALAAALRSVTVTWDTDHLVVASNSSGSSSSVNVLSGTSLSALGFTGGSTTNGAEPYAFFARTNQESRNQGGARISTGQVIDKAAVTLDDYLIKFRSATSYDVFNLSSPFAVTAASTNTGGAVRSDAGVVDAGRVTLDNYDVRFNNLYTVTSANNALRFDPGSGAATVTLTAGKYTGSQLATELQTRLNAAGGGNTYTVTFDSPTAQFTIQNNAGNSAAATLSFDDTATTAEDLLGFNPTAVSISVGGAATGNDTQATSGATLFYNVLNSSQATNVYNVTSSNNVVYLNGGAVTLRTGSYTGTQLAAEIQRALGAGYSTAYSTSGGRPSRSFTITNSTGAAVTFNWSNSGATAATLLGFEPTDSAVANGGTDASDFDAGNLAYVSGANVEFDGLRTVINDGAAAGPRTGDSFAVSPGASTLLANQIYASGSAIQFKGLQVTISDGTTGPAANDVFRVLTGIRYQGDSGLQSIEVGDNQTIRTNLPGNQVFSGTTVDMFAGLKNLVAALQGNYGGGIGQGIADVDDAVTQVSNARGEIGALSNRLDNTKQNLDAAKELVIRLLSENEDVDLVKVVSQLTQQELALQVASEAASRVLQNSLLNFLK
jgi:flagellar hook-associated protein 3 FlgL